MRVATVLAIALMPVWAPHVFSLPVAQGAKSPIVIPATIVAEAGVMVQVKVDGQGPYPFLIDSGAADSYLIDLELAKKLGCRLNHAFSGTGAGEGKYATYRCGPESLQVGGLTIADAPVVAIEMRPVCMALGRRIAGVLGHDLFQKHAVAIDFLAGTVTVSDRADFVRPTSGVELPLRSARGLMLVNGAITVEKGRPVPATFLIDTGAILADLFLNAPFAGIHAPEASSSGVPTRYHTIAGTTRFVMRRIAQLRVGPLVLERPVADISLDRKGVLAGNEWDAVLGGGVLRRFRVTFDLPDSRLFLEPNSEFSKPFLSDCSGLVLRGGGSSFDRYEVDAVIANSPAALAGVRENDELRTVNGVPVAQLGLGEVRRIFRDENSTAHITLDRSGKLFAVTLHLRRLV